MADLMKTGRIRVAKGDKVCQTRKKPRVIGPPVSQADDADSQCISRLRGRSHFGVAKARARDGGRGFQDAG